MSKWNFSNWHVNPNFRLESIDVLVDKMGDFDNHDETGHQIQDELLIQALIGLSELVSSEYQESIYNLIAAYDKTEKWYA